MIRFVTLLAPFCLIAAAIAEDWTEFRGPQGQGRSGVESLPLEWSESRHIAWKVPVAGTAWSSPVVAGGRVYLTTAVPKSEDDPNEQSLRALCLKADSGEVVWDVEVFHQNGQGVRLHKKNSHASATPLLEGNRLYVHFGPQGTACLTTEGDVVWKNEELKFSPVHGNGGSPAVFGDTLIFTCDGGDQQFVAGLDKNTGSVKWKTPRDTDATKGFSFCTPTLVDVNGNMQAICPGSGAVISYDPETGDEIWRVDYGEGYSVVPRPVFGHGLVFVCSGYDQAVLYAIDPTGQGDVTDSHVKWTINRGVPRSASLLLVGNELYFVDDGGVASCVDARTGELHWQERLGGGFSASPFFGAGRIYFQHEEGGTTVVAPGRDFEQLAKNQIGDNDRTFASYAVVDNAILLRSETHLYRIEE